MAAGGDFLMAMDTMNLTFNLPSNQLKEVSVKKSTMLLMLVLTLVVMAASLTGCGGSSTKTNPATEDTTTTTASGSDATAPDDETDDAEGGSVSYTHLDVYKRQGNRGSEAYPRPLRP